MEHGSRRSIPILQGESSIRIPVSACQERERSPSDANTHDAMGYNETVLGSIGKLLGRPVFLFLFALQFVAVLSLAGYVFYGNSSAECIRCHADRDRMTELGYPYLYMTAEQVEKETKHRGVACHECHFGDGRAERADEAHEGMLKAVYLGHDAEILKRKDWVESALIPTGDDALRTMLPKEKDEDGDFFEDSWVRNVLYHDRNTLTFGYDPDLGKKACGQRACHPREAEQFEKTVMGTNFRQRTMRTWIEPYGPQNCGPSFADTPPVREASGNRFDFRNQKAILDDLNAPFSEGQAVAKQKYCNVCHAGCLDCHFAPYKNEGAHLFAKKPSAESCTGGGRGSSMCHSGSMERRRGDSYLGGDFSAPPGMEPDAHVKKKIVCVDCHITGPGGMGDIQRAASCADCHLEAERSHAASLHRNVTCEACHVQKVSGYQMTYWGPGEVAGEPNPFKKYSLYLGTFEPPILIEDQKGKWFPVKIWPHSLGNFGPEVPPGDGIRFRWPDGETRDAYVMLGTFDDLPGNNRHLAWLEIEQVAHPFAKSRTCESCHGSRQVARSSWTFVEEEAEEFSGSYRIEAGDEELHLKDLESEEIILTDSGANLIDFAPWVYLGDIWRIKGDFSIPGKNYEEEKRLNDLALDELKQARGRMSEKQWKKRMSVLVHNPEMGLRELNEPPRTEIRLRNER